MQGGGLHTCTTSGASTYSPRHRTSRLSVLLTTFLAAAACSDDAPLTSVDPPNVPAGPRPGFAATQVVAGFDHTCALKGDGSTFCWGTNWTGQLGRGYVDRQANSFPLEVSGHRFKELAAGAGHTCGLTDHGVTYCWGYNQAGQVGSGGADAVAVPVRVEGAPAFIALTAGWFHSCGLTSGGEVYCWGDDSFGQLGRGTDRSTAAPVQAFSHPRPERVAGSLHFTSISASPSATSTCGVADGVAYCWGQSLDGVLGRNVQQQCRVSGSDEFSGETKEHSEPCSSAPIPVSTHAAVTSVLLERYGACAILTSAALECWGFRTPPTLVPAASVTTAWVLWSMVCGADDAGQVTCWRMLPPFGVENPFGGAGPLLKLHSSGRPHCGITRATSLVYCWGANYDGALGDGTTTHRDFPVAVVSPLSGGH
jgi:alpha-tubulin suppressor-like RCC1 family protein